MGLAPAAPNFVDSIPPMVGGGNIDDRRMGVGATMCVARAAPRCTACAAVLTRPPASVTRQVP